MSNMIKAEKVYVFKFFEIECCFDCPLFYDYISCEADCAGKVEKYTDTDDGKRPDNCPLKELF